MNKKILFLTLRVFSATGGIEKVCRVFGKALTDIGLPLYTFSMYDEQQDVMEKYIPAASFRGFGTNKLRFVAAALQQALKSDIIVISHINLLSVGYLAKLFFPEKKLYLFVHGIEVWDNISAARKKMLNKCDVILSVSNFTKNKLVEQAGLDAGKITVLHNCLDPFLPAPVAKKEEGLLRKYGFAKDDTVLLTLTRMSSKELYKGYDHVLYSIKELKQKFPRIKYLLVGKCDETERKRLDAIIDICAIKEQVVFTGYIPDEELASHYSLADVYVMPSKKEGFGIVFIEAMYYGLPVIAGNKDGSVDALADGKLGLLVDPDSQEQINKVIEKAIMQNSGASDQKKMLMDHFGYDSYKEKCRDIFAAV